MDEQPEYEVAVKLGRSFDVRLADGWFLTGTSEIRVPFAYRESAEQAAGEVEIIVRQRTDGGQDGGELREALAARKREITDLRRQLAEASAVIDRLTAELDDARGIPAEYVPASGLQAAMTADPHREDGTVLRETGGQKRAYRWKAAAGEWEQVG